MSRFPNEDKVQGTFCELHFIASWWCKFSRRQKIKELKNLSLYPIRARKKARTPEGLNLASVRWTSERCFFPDIHRTPAKARRGQADWAGNTLTRAHVDIYGTGGRDCVPIWSEVAACRRFSNEDRDNVGPSCLHFMLWARDCVRIRRRSLLGLPRAASSTIVRPMRWHWSPKASFCALSNLDVVVVVVLLLLGAVTWGPEYLSRPAGGSKSERLSEFACGPHKVRCHRLLPLAHLLSIARLLLIRVSGFFLPWHGEFL